MLEFYWDCVTKPLILLLSLGYLVLQFWAVHYGPLSPDEREKRSGTP